MKALGLNLTVEGNISDFLRIQIDRMNENTFNLSQPHLINGIIKEFCLDGQNVAIKKTTGVSSKTLCSHLDSPPFDDHFNYCRAIGQMKCLEKFQGVTSHVLSTKEQVCVQSKAATWQARH